MPFVQAKCPECGGMLAVDDSKRAAVCQFCGEAFIVQEAVINNNTYNTTNHNYGEGAVVNVYEDTNKDFVIEAGVLKEYHGASVDVVIPDGVTEIGENCFKDLKIKTVVIPNSVTSIGDSAFKDCKSLISIEVDEVNLNFSSQDGVLFNKDKTTLIKYPSDKTGSNYVIFNSVTQIGAHAFENCENLTSVTIPDSVTSIGDCAFRWCSNLGVMIIPNGVTNISNYAFIGTPYYVAENERKFNEKKDRLKAKREELAKVQGLICVNTGANIVYGLKSDGTVVAVGKNDNGKYHKEDWVDIIAISAGLEHTVGLKSDGTVITEYKKSPGLNEYSGQCNVFDWTDIIAISAGNVHTVGLKSDGTVVAVGYNKYGQCDTTFWKDIVAISAGDEHTIGLKSDGTVIATKYPKSQLTLDYYGQCNVSDWTDIVAIFAQYKHTIGLKSNGTVVAVGLYMEDYTDIIRCWQVGDRVVGIKSNGVAVTEGCGYISLDKFKLFNDINTLEEERIYEIQRLAEHERYREKQMADFRRSKGFCQHCGGKFKGLFSSKCSRCGKPKDY